jgi:hypothetical protein
MSDAHGVHEQVNHCVVRVSRILVVNIFARQPQVVFL